ncbi:hypothetical protein [Streptomyces sp. NPDC018031]|uniref:hypothetical protein n=1 Tax=Streptomyces sp. NPDC018031 TaxID=3365033 RepID=UPI00378B601B
MSFAVDATPEQLVRLTGSGPGADPMPEKTAEVLAGLRVTLSVQTRKPVAEAAEKDVVGSAVTVSGADGELVEYRLIGDTAYYRVDPDAIGGLTDVPLPDATEADELFPEAGDGIRRALEGKWIKIDTAGMGPALDELGAGAGKESGADAGRPRPGFDLGALKRELTAVKGVVLADAGTRDGADHVVATGSARRLLTGIVGSLRPFTEGLPGGGDLPTAEDLGDVPDEKLSVDFAIRDGKLSRVTADLAPAVEGLKEGEKLPLALEFGEAGPVKAPAGATEVDFADLLAGLSALAVDSISGDNFTVEADTLDGTGFEQYGDLETGDEGISGLRIDADQL